ncbi:TfpX/TfpZ family type IV pilin accessory protein [uncultured Hydrogenophaga sp.]|uniref:TfpX/TfpZ family type IV pilin accessory protein n=1 Tax=uncultured Hydrogenophaga sp. TaxID=199683 RepID=UPI0026601AE4|nr:TfpX/TfpZ family type IV pilin accessory protein [uncultured Hydrogenophaga sp.]
MSPSNIFRLRWSGTHLLISLLLAAAVAALVFLVWFPSPFRELSGGFKLFLIIVAVDVVLGPCATLVVANQSKSRRELRTDVALIGLIQLLALGYGLWTLAQARPVYMAFEIDRFRVVHAVDVDPGLLAQAPEQWRDLPLGRPQLVAVRPFRSAEERADATFAALSGVNLGARPDFWMPYADAVAAVKAEAKPLSELLQRKPDARPAAEAMAQKLGRPVDGLLYLPVAGRNLFWTALIDPATGMPLEYLPVDPY